MDGLAISPLLVTDSLWTINSENPSALHISALKPLHQESRPWQVQQDLLPHVHKQASIILQREPYEDLSTFRLTQICFS